MFRKVFFSLFIVLSLSPFLSQMNASENDHLARVHWNININTGFYPYYCAPGPYYGYPPYPPCCAYPYPAPAPYWMW